MVGMRLCTTATLDMLEYAILNSAVTDRGHRHSTGRTEICFYIDGTKEHNIANPLNPAAPVFAPQIQANGGDSGTGVHDMEDTMPTFGDGTGTERVCGLASHETREYTVDNDPTDDSRCKHTWDAKRIQATPSLVVVDDDREQAAASTSTSVAGGSKVLLRDLEIIRDAIVRLQVVLDEQLFQSLISRCTILTDQFSDTLTGRVQFSSAAELDLASAKLTHDFGLLRDDVKNAISELQDRSAPDV